MQRRPVIVDEDVLTGEEGNRRQDFFLKNTAEERQMGKFRSVSNEKSQGWCFELLFFLTTGMIIFKCGR